MKIDIDMMNLDKIARFLAGSHRWMHLVCGLLVGLVFGVQAAVCVAFALEVKDVQHDKYNARLRLWKWRWKSWDWVDFACTVAGGLLGSLVRWLVIGRFM